MRHYLCAMKMEYSDQESCHDILKSEKNNWNRVCLAKLNQRARYATESRYIAHDHETFIFGQTVDQCSQGIIWLKCMPTIPIHTELKNTQIEYYFRRFFFMCRRRRKLFVRMLSYRIRYSTPLTWDFREQNMFSTFNSYNLVLPINQSTRYPDPS